MYLLMHISNIENKKHIVFSSRLGILSYGNSNKKKTMCTETAHERIRRSMSRDNERGKSYEIGERQLLMELLELWSFFASGF